MSVLQHLSRRTRLLLLTLNLAAAAAVLVNWWLAVWPNLAASWAQWSVLIALAAPLGAWATRLLDRHHDRTAHRIAVEHADTRRHVEARLAEHAAAQNDRLDVLSNQVAALHAKLDRQAGGAA